MSRCYSACVPYRQSSRTGFRLPDVWLVSDAVNDAGLEAALRHLPQGSGLIVRHYHLSPSERRQRFLTLRRMARARGHCIVLSGSAGLTRCWGADGAYGPAERLVRGPKTLRLITAHSLREIAGANRHRADAVLLSPAFPTRSHPGAPALGPVRFRLLAMRSKAPVIALGGMTARRARQLGIPRWAAIRAFT